MMTSLRQSITRDAPSSQGGEGETHCSKVNSNHPSQLACCLSKERMLLPLRPWREHLP
jgi:hypothetical protein